MDEDNARYLDIEQMVKRELRDAERVYVNGILQNSLESGNNKPFWKYVKSQKQETFGISALKSNVCIIFMFLQCVSTVIIVYIIISPLNSYLYIHWILDFK